MSHPLDAVVDGPVLRPGDDGFAAETATFNTAIVHRPDVVVGATSTEDVAETVRWARAQGVPVRVFGAGHSGPPASGGVLVSTRRLTDVEVDPQTGVARLGAGVRWGDVVAAAAPHGLAPIAGSSPTVGVVGFLLGGGIGPFVRSHGFGSDHLASATVVTGEGEVVVASGDEHPELLWALRGGKYALGIVTEVTVQLARVPSLYAGSLVFDTEHVAAAFTGWLRWTATADASTATSAAVLRLPPIDAVPPPLRGRTVLTLRFSRPGDAAEGEAVAAPLRALAPVLVDQLGQLPLERVPEIYGDPTEPMPGWSAGALLEKADDDLAAVWLGEVGPGAALPFVGAELRHLGSAAASTVSVGSAVVGLDAAYGLSLFTSGPPPYDAQATAATALLSSLEPWLANEVNPNFAGPIRSARWPSAVAERLAQVRRRYDPDGVLGPR